VKFIHRREILSQYQQNEKMHHLLSLKISAPSGDYWPNRVRVPDEGDGECQYRQFLPLTDEVIRWHLSGFDHAGGPFVAGIYPTVSDCVKAGILPFQNLRTQGAAYENSILLK
jgi:hypothetical protein